MDRKLLLLWLCALGVWLLAWCSWGSGDVAHNAPSGEMFSVQSVSEGCYSMVEMSEWRCAPCRNSADSINANSVFQDIINTTACDFVVETRNDAPMRTDLFSDTFVWDHSVVVDQFSEIVAGIPTIFIYDDAWEIVYQWHNTNEAMQIMIDNCESCSESVSFCGDWIMEAWEECDDGNTISNDGCSNTCQNEYLRCQEDSTCWYQSSNNWTTCMSDNDCLPVAICGNGVVEQGEQCGEPWLSCPYSKTKPTTCVECGCESLLIQAEVELEPATPTVPSTPTVPTATPSPTITSGPTTPTTSTTKYIPVKEKAYPQPWWGEIEREPVFKSQSVREVWLSQWKETKDEVSFLIEESSMRKSNEEYFDWVPCADVDWDGISDIELSNFNEFLSIQEENACECVSSHTTPDGFGWMPQLVLADWSIIPNTMDNILLYCPDWRLLGNNETMYLVGECSDEVLGFTFWENIAFFSNFDDLCPNCGNGEVDEWEQCGEPWLSCPFSKTNPTTCVECGCESLLIHADVELEPATPTIPSTPTVPGTPSTPTPSTPGPTVTPTVVTSTTSIWVPPVKEKAYPQPSGERRK